MVIYLVASKTVGSFLIRLFTWSKFSHVVAEDGDMIIEAHWLHGVRKISRSSLFHYARNIQPIFITVADDEKVLEALRSQLRKPYDWRAILGFIFRNRNWQDESAWECAELIAWAFAKAGCPIFRGEEKARIVPDDFWLISPNLLERK